MYTPINGFTKQKILDVISARPTDGPALQKDGYNCAYKASDGARCAIGLFIPEGHPGENFQSGVYVLIERYPELEFRMPLSVDGLIRFQRAHDNESPWRLTDRKFNGNAKAAMLDWVEKNVQDNSV